MRLFLWALTICAWLASAAFSWQVASTLFMFGALDRPTVPVRLIVWAPVAAIGVLAVCAAVRRKAVWLPVTLLLSPALQAAGLVLAKLDPVI